MATSIRPRTELTDFSNIRRSAGSSCISIIFSTPFAPITAGTPTQYTLSGPGTVTPGAASTNFTITIQDAFGNTTNTTQNTTFTLASTAAGTVTFAPVSPVTVTTGTSSVTFTYTATQAGSKTITATRASGDAVGGPQTAGITVNAGAAAKLQLLVPGESAAAGSGTGKTGKEVVAYAESKGFILRPESEKYGSDGWFRITIGTKEEDRAAVEVIRGFLTSKK